MSYQNFLKSKTAIVPPTGFEPSLLPRGPFPSQDELFPYQQDLIRWAVRRGRAALFVDTGLGKTIMQLAWAEQVAKHTQGQVLVLCPLAVAAQTVRESARFGIAALVSNGDGDEGIILVANYEKLHRFDLEKFTGIVLDESSILKSYSGKVRNQIVEGFARTPYRLSCTATPAPNDHEELGNQAEFLGVCSRVEMLSEFFVHDGGDTSSWRLKGHAKDAFWKWLCSWALVVRRPSDLGYEDGAHALPPLIQVEHRLEVSTDPFALGDQGLLFPQEARSLTERRAARKSSISERVEMAASLVAAEPDEPWLVWCNLNAEGDALAAAIPGAVQIAGADTPYHKEASMLDFASGSIRVLVTKPSLAGFGLNWQHCARVAFVGLSDSYEQFYQAIRRCWRFGQTREVHVHLILSEAEGAVLANLRRKEAEAVAMGEGMAKALATRQIDNIRGQVRERDSYAPAKLQIIPHWLAPEALQEAV